MKKRLNFFTILVVLLFVFFSFCNSVHAKNISELKPDKIYTFDLDGNGSKEKISYSLTSSCVYKIKINNKIAKEIQMDEYTYEPHMQVFDSNKSSKGLDIWIYTYGGSDDMFYSGLYEYSDGDIVLISEASYDNDIPLGFVCNTNGVGTFSVSVPVLGDGDVARLIGNHNYKVVLKKTSSGLKNVTGNTYEFKKTYGSNYGKSKWLITLGKLKFYKSASKKSKTFSVRKGTKCVPKKFKVVASKYYVLFKLRSGKKGWICADGFGYDKQAFKDICLAG